MLMVNTKSLIVALFIASVGAAFALPPLEQNARVQSEFLAGAVGDEIRKNCPTISARLFRVAARVSKLEQYALSLGYTSADIAKMRKDAKAKARLKAMRNDYLTKNGVVAGDADSYCNLGRAEIQKKSLTGWLLREN